MADTINREERIPEAMIGMRLDQACAEIFSDYSASVSSTGSRPVR